MATLNAKNRLTKPFIPNSKLVFGLDLGNKIRRGHIILHGSITIGGGTTNGTVYREGGPTELLQRIKVLATPAGGSRYLGGYIVDCTARALLRNAVTQRNGKFFADMLGATLGNGAAGTYNVYLPIPIYFADATQRNQLTTALNTDAGTYSSVQVQIDTGSIANCFTGTDRTVTDLYANLTVDWEDERVGIAGDTTVLYQESHEFLIPAANKRALDDAMPRDGHFMSWQICAQQSAQKNLSDAILNRLVTAGPTLDYDKYANDIRATDLADEWFDPSNTNTGMYFIDWTDGAVQANTVDAGTLSTYFDVSNPSGASLDSLEFFTRRVISPAPAGK